jgi:predicted DNA-binding protein (MmcQ/YjbR family)
VTNRQTLARLRKICLAQPDAVETHNWGCEWFRIRGKFFCVFHGPPDAPGIGFKVGKADQGIFLDDPRFFKTHYMWHHGWVSLQANATLDWEEVEELVKGSYALVSTTGKSRRKTTGGSTR